MKVILYEDLRFSRTKEQLVQIVADTGADLILRSASRFSKDSLHGIGSVNLAENIAAIHSKFPNTKIIGNVYWQIIGRGERDDITGQLWTSQQVYDTLTFDPTKYNLTGITKCQIQCYDSSCTCIPGGYTDVQFGGSYIPDLSIPDVQLLYIHQAQKLLELGCDGIWIDGPFINVGDVARYGGTEATIQYFYDANLYTMEQIRKLKTLSGNSPMIATWYSGTGSTKYLQNSPYWHDKFFDFVTISAPFIDEIITISPKQDYDKIVNDIKVNYGDVPIITYMDWWWNNHPMWYFSQWYPGYTDQECCNGHYEERHNHQINVLRYFTKFFKLKGITWAYPIHCPGCSTDTCPGVTTPDSGTCCAKSFGQYYSYDALAPEHNTYAEIVSLMNPPNKMLILGLLATITAGYFLVVNRNYNTIKKMKEV